MRQGKFFDLELEGVEPAQAEARLRGYCEKLLANTVIEETVFGTPTPAAPVRWRGEASLWVAAAGVCVQMEAVTGVGLKRDVLAAGEVALGVRQGGERLRLHPGGPHRSLKNLLQERAIPPWQRNRLPLLWCDGQLAWAAGIGLDADLGAEPGEAGVLPRIEQV